MLAIGAWIFSSPLVQAQTSSAVYNRNLSVGDSGSDVASLQSYLIANGFLDINGPTGYFGALTQAAVEKWQAAEGLPSTGYFGVLSRAAIADGKVPINTESASTTPAVDSVATTSQTFSANLSIGDSGSDVASLQSYLIANGFLDINGPTGYFGALTQAAVEKWQAAEGLPSTGYFGVLSRAAIENTTSTLSLDSGASSKNASATSTTSPIASTTSVIIPSVPVFSGGGGGGGGGSSTPPPQPATPSVPQNLTITAVGTSNISLEWSTSAESGGVIVGYNVLRGGVLIATTSVTSFADNDLSAGTTYSYSISSYDTSGTTSANSTSVNTTTLAISPATSLNYNYGISVGGTLLGLPSSTLNAELNDITSLGIGWIRFDIEWEWVQPNNSSTFNWGNFDTFIAAANAHHIKLLPLLGYTPTWAETPTCATTIGSDRCPPASDAQYDAFVQAVVTRYAPLGISDWEIWNEPNLGGAWEPVADPVAYTALLKSAYTTIKGIQPSATVITGGLSPAASDGTDLSPTDFLTQLYANGAQGYFDAVGDHPYSYPAMPLYYAPWNAWSQIASTTPSLQSIMAANGDGNKKIWLTEYGAPTNGPGLLESSASDTLFIGHPDHVTEALQAQMLSEAITTTESASWAGPLFIYSYQDLGTSTSSDENFFGLVRADGSDKPAYTTVKNLLQ